MYPKKQPYGNRLSYAQCHTILIKRSKRDQGRTNTWKTWTSRCCGTRTPCDLRDPQEG